MENQYEMYKINNYLSSENSGASLYEALDRYKRYERKLEDQVRPNEDTLRKLSNAPFKIQTAPVVKTNFSIFPNGERSINREKDVSASSDLLNDDDYLSDSTNDVQKNKAEKFDLSNGKKTLPSIGRTRSTNAKNTSNEKNNRTNKSAKTNSKLYADNSEDGDSEGEEDSFWNETKQNDQENSAEIIYNLDTVLKYLEQGYFLRWKNFF